MHANACMVQRSKQQRQQTQLLVPLEPRYPPERSPPNPLQRTANMARPSRADCIMSAATHTNRCGDMGVPLLVVWLLRKHGAAAALLPCCLARSLQNAPDPAGKGDMRS